MTTPGGLRTRGAMLLLSLVAFRMGLEQSMWLHMLVQMPLLVLAGIWLASPRPPSPEPLSRQPDRKTPVLAMLLPYNVAGVPGLLLASAAIAVWMIPRPLDAATESWMVDALKFALLVVSGAIGAASWRQAGTVVRLFVLGNAVWMAATVGVLLLDAPNRVCVRYGANDQTVAGYGLVLATLFVVVAALVRFSHSSTSTHVATSTCT